MQPVNTYKQAIYDIKHNLVNVNPSEESYRTSLHNFLNRTIEDKKLPLKVFAEISEKKDKIIIPDFSCISTNFLSTIGYIETKNYNFNIRDRQYKWIKKIPLFLCYEATKMKGENVTRTMRK